MKRYQQHTHASWHRAYAGKFDCPWCHEHPQRSGSTTPQNQNHQRKLAKGSDTSRTRATATPLGHHRQHSSSSGSPRKYNGVPSEPQTPEAARHTVNGHEASPGQESVDANYAEYNGRTVRHNGLNGAFMAETPRPPLPEAWTKDTEEQQHDAMAWSGSTAQTPPSGLETPSDFRASGDKQVDPPELTVQQVEES
ncbi:hypothetical protein N7457_000427 [Penicillium paradoxum]|uniref:uncharacterized protein n=1 Tax=Penicillium paradoxum TaxID=176176 RepID=UPI002547BFD5|nr:uncharacterized protein N7457_000427 [Penicillium paradoxum]KAJ5793828.1 hypothetical protein N7457_000427 [Penicillium paradoxum]